MNLQYWTCIILPLAVNHHLAMTADVDSTWLFRGNAVLRDWELIPESCTNTTWVTAGISLVLRSQMWLFQWTLVPFSSSMVLLSADCPTAVVEWRGMGWNWAGPFCKYLEQSFERDLGHSSYWEIKLKTSTVPYGCLYLHVPIWCNTSESGLSRQLNCVAMTHTWGKYRMCI